MRLLPMMKPLIAKSFTEDFVNVGKSPAHNSVYNVDLCHMLRDLMTVLLILLLL